MKGSVIVFCSNEPMELALTNQLAEKSILKGIVIELRRNSRNPSLAEIAKKILNKLLFYFLIDKSWINAQKWFKYEYGDFPGVPTIVVENINDEQTFSFLQTHKPDLVAVSGTSLLRKPLLAYAPKLGIINLHTGLSPYVKGGPNCTNWCLATRSYHLIGNTVMWLDEGIDSGSIICTDVLTLNKDWSHSELLKSVIVEGQKLYMEVITMILNLEPIPSVMQDKIGRGRTYYSREWTFYPRLKLVVNFYFGNYRQTIGKKKHLEAFEKVELIKLKR